MESKLTIARKRKHWTREEAAEYLDINANTLYRWEAGTVMPRGYNLRKLCDLYGMTEAELGFDEEHMPMSGTPLNLPERSEGLLMIIDQDLTLRLLSLAFIPHGSYQEVQDALTLMLQEYDLMNSNPAAFVARREALRRLAMFTLLHLGITTDAQRVPRRADEILDQCAASIAACWELSRSSEETDIELAFQGVGAYEPMLREIVKTASPPQRKIAASLVSQCALLQEVLGWHFTGLKIATKHGQDAVLYSEISEDVSLRLSSLKCLAWTYYYDHRSTQALQSMEQARALFDEHKNVLPVYAHANIYSTLAVMQAKNGNQADTTLRSAEKTAFRDEKHPVYVDAPVPAFIRNAGMAFYQQRNYDQANAMLSNLIDTTTLKAKRSLPERTRVEVINTMTVTSMKARGKDLEQSLHFWKAGIQGAKKLQSEQRFTEAIAAYDIMEALWPDEKRITELRELTQHW